MKRIHLGVGFAIAALGVAVMLVAEEAAALECVAPTKERLTLELESVEVDGEPLDDTSEYAGFHVHLEGSPFDGDERVDFNLFAFDGDRAWTEAYQ